MYIVAGAEDHFQDLPARRNTTSVIKELLPQSQSNKLRVLQVTRGRDPPRTGLEIPRSVILGDHHIQASKQ